MGLLVTQSSGKPALPLHIINSVELNLISDCPKTASYFDCALDWDFTRKAQVPSYVSLQFTFKSSLFSHIIYLWILTVMHLLA